MMKNKSWIFVFVTLFFGALIYLLFKPPFSWMPNFFGWNKAIISLSWLPSPISIFIKCHLSDILWALSFAEMIYIFKHNYYYSFFIVLIFTILLNISQYYGITMGTADILDVLFIFGFLVIYIIISKEIKKDEKKI